jgi:ribosomal protein L13E
MWTRGDWHEFFRTMGNRWTKYRPPRPVDVSLQGRVIPTSGFSLRELDAAGLTLAMAQTLELPVDAGRVGVNSANINALRDFARAARHGG